MKNIPLKVEALSRRTPLGSRLTCLTVLFLSFPLPVLAALGEGPTSSIGGRAQAQATVQAGPGERYTVHQVVMPSGTVVREYVSPSGTVFGVAWRGPAMPDLRQLLGQYFEPYANAVSAKRRGHGPVTVEQPQLVVRSGGHMRSFVGTAYLPASLPQGVSPEEIR